MDFASQCGFLDKGHKLNLVSHQSKYSTIPYYRWAVFLFAEEQESNIVNHMGSTANSTGTSKIFATFIAGQAFSDVVIIMTTAIIDSQLRPCLVREKFWISIQ